MKLTTRARYALRMMLDIHKAATDAPVSLQAVSGRTQISRRYLEQLATVLKGAGLVRGTTGKAGGYRLTRPASAISIGEIVEAAIGPINIVDCVKEPDACCRSGGCECRSVYSLINDRITQVLHEISLAELASQEQLEVVMDHLAAHGS